MCQCVVCDCWWCNFCGVCAGCTQQLLCIGFWCCKPDSFPIQGQKNCMCCERAGWGSNFLCYGGLCCAPDWLVKWSNSAKK